MADPESSRMGSSCVCPVQFPSLRYTETAWEVLLPALDYESADDTAKASVARMRPVKWIPCRAHRNRETHTSRCANKFASLDMLAICKNFSWPEPQSQKLNLSNSWTMRPSQHLEVVVGGVAAAGQSGSNRNTATKQFVKQWLGHVQARQSLSR